MSTIAENGVPEDFEGPGKVRMLGGLWHGSVNYVAIFRWRLMGLLGVLAAGRDVCNGGGGVLDVKRRDWPGGSADGAPRGRLSLA